MIKRAAKDKTRNATTTKIEAAFASQYLPKHPDALITVYRYNPWAYRVRIIDPDFHGLNIVERETDAMAVVRSLPDDVQDRISMLLLITPAEREQSLSSLEFDDPKPSPAR